MNRTIHELFEEQVNRTPNHIALVWGENKLTYAELNQKANQISSQLRKKGLGVESLVGIMLKRSFDMIISILGVLKAGSAYLPIDPEYPAERIQFMLEDSNTQIILSQSTLSSEVDFSGEVIHVDKLMLSGGDPLNLISLNTPDHLAYVIYTSGSTGTPKGVMIEHRAVTNFIKGVTEVIEFAENKTIVAQTTISFDIFLLETLLPLTKGMTIVLADERVQKNPKLLAEMMSANKVDMLQMTPSRMQLLLNYDKELTLLRNVKEIMIGGEVLSPAILHTIQAHTNARIYNMYGPTETTVWSTVSDVSTKDRVDIGKPITDTYIYIFDETNNLAQVSVGGELWIGGRGLARGYLHRTDLTAAMFVTNPFIPGERMYRTGDRARWLPDGDIEYLGRTDDQVKIRGHRIELGEIETTLLKHKHIQQAVVTAREGKEKTAYLCAYFVSEEELIPTDLRDHLSKTLPDSMIPAYFVPIKCLPQTPNGKLDRNALPDPETFLCTQEQQPMRPEEKPVATCVEGKIITLLKENIEIAVEDIDVSTNLADLGIDSINFLKLVVAIEAEFDFELPVEDLEAERFPTVYSLVSYVEYLI